MKKTRLLHGMIFLILLVGLTSCYTRLGYVSDEPVYDGNDQYGDQDGQYYDDSQGQDQEVIVNHIYLPPSYHPRYIYFDPYDEWYFEPGFGFWFSYYSGPVYISVPFYYPPYPYPYPYPVCYPPVYYPVPVYYPPVWGGGYHGPHYAYSPPPLKRREFGRRTEMVYTAPRALSRRSGSDGSGSGTVSRRTLTKAPDSGSDNGGVSGRRTDGRRGQTFTPPPDDSDYGRYSTRRRSQTTSDQKDSDNKRRTSNSNSSGSYSPGQSTNSEPGYSAPVPRRSNTSSGSVSGSSGQKSSTPKVSSSPSPRSSSSSSRPTVRRSSNSSASRGSSGTTTSRPAVSRSSSSSSGSSSSRSSSSSSRPSVSRSSGGSRVSSGSVSRPSPASSSSSSGGSRSSSSSGKSRRR
jgi:hypothetical protein